MNPRKKPSFKRYAANTKRVKKNWRRPRGRDNKMKRGEKAKGKRPSVGYGAPRKMRFLHPSGFREVLVANVNDLNKINAENEAARIISTVGKRKRIEIINKAKELKIKVLNA